MSGTARDNFDYVTAGQNQKEVTIDAALDKIDARFDHQQTTDVTSGNTTISLATLQACAEVAAIGSPAANRTVTLPVFTGYRTLSNNISTVHTVTFTLGSTSFILSKGQTGQFRGDGTTNGLFQTSPIVAPIPGDAIDVGFFANGKPLSAALVSSVVLARNVSLDVNLPGSQAVSGVAAAASAVFHVQKNSVNVGTITFALGATVGTFAMASAQTFIAGDTLDLIAPSPQDTTLQDIRITIVGKRTT